MFVSGRSQSVSDGLEDRMWSDLPPGALLGKRQVGADGAAGIGVLLILWIVRTIKWGEIHVTFIH